MTVGAAEDDQDARFATRTNMFIAAVLTSKDGPCPVRIRNMSTNGALVEAPTLPAPGTDVSIERHSLRARGRIAWVSAGRCGIELEQIVAVADWMANPANRKQEQVDRLVAEVRAGRHAVSASRPSLVRDRAPRPDLCDHLEQLGRLLNLLGDELAGDPSVLRHHASGLQRLDLAGQMIDALKQSVGEDAAQRQAGYARLRSLRDSAEDRL